MDIAQHTPRPVALPRRRAFTLIELLLVVLILGISLAAVVPRLSGLLDGGRTAVAVRTLARAGRYARTMALLNQLPMDLQVDLDRALVRVAAAPRGTAGGASGLFDSGAPAGAGGHAFGRAVSRNERLEEERARFHAARGAPPPSADTNSPDAAATWTDEIALEQALEDVVLRFEGFVDRTDARGADAATNGVITVRYRANGTCRPHRFVVAAERIDEIYRLDVDAVGTPRLSRQENTLGRR